MQYVFTHKKIPKTIYQLFYYQPIMVIKVDNKVGNSSNINIDKVN